MVDLFATRAGQKRRNLKQLLADRCKLTGDEASELARYLLERANGSVTPKTTLFNCKYGTCHTSHQPVYAMIIDNAEHHDPGNALYTQVIFGIRAADMAEVFSEWSIGHSLCFDDFIYEK